MSHKKVQQKPRSSAFAPRALPLLRSAAAKSAFYVPWVSLCAAPLCDLLLGSNAHAVGAALLLLSALFFGLPHGASDLQVLKRLLPRTRTKRAPFILASAIYLCLALAMLGLWAISPPIALVLFLSVSAWHFGEGDVVWSREAERLWPFEAIGRGLLIIMAPIYFHPVEARSILLGLLDGADVAHAGRTIAALQSLAGPLLIIALGLTAAGNVASLRHKGLAIARGPFVVPSNPQALKWLEVALLLLAFWATSPLLALAFYFVGVHSWRHILRLQVRSGEFAGAWRAAWFFHRRWLAATALTLAIFLPFLWLKGRGWLMEQPVSAYLILLSALALPHAALIAWAESDSRSQDETDEQDRSPLSKKGRNANLLQTTGAKIVSRA